MTRPTDPTRNDALQPDERALARELERAAPAGGPPPALDAAILAAARDAAATRARSAGASTPAPSGGATGHSRRRRSAAWLRGGALAATVVIAVGVSWQLRPRFDAPEAATTAEQAIVAPAPAGAGAGTAPPPPTAEALPSGGVPEATPPATSGPAPETGRRAASRPLRASPVREEPPVVFDDPSPVAAPVAAPAALPAIAEPRTQAAAKEARARRRADDPIEHGHADDQAVETTGMDQPLDDIPPASVDSPAVREAWLDRIRELEAAGRHEDARASFAEFRRRHPDAPVPDDLQSRLGQ